MVMVTAKHYWKCEFANKQLAEAAYEEFETRLSHIRIESVKDKVFIFDTSERTRLVVTEVTEKFKGHAKLYTPRPEVPVKN